MMDKKGFALSWIIPVYVLVNIIIFLMIFGKIEMNKDDTAYYLDFYSKDISQGSQALLWSDGEGDYSYNLREGYELKINNQGEVFVRSGYSEDSYKFKPRTGFKLVVSELGEGIFLISKEVKSL